MKGRREGRRAKKFRRAIRYVDDRPIANRAQVACRSNNGKMIGYTPLTIGRCCTDPPKVGGESSSSSIISSTISGCLCVGRKLAGFFVITSAAKLP